MTVIQSWTNTSTVKKNDWNTLRILSTGSTFKFHINGTLVKSFTDTTRTSGYVGFEMYKNTTSTQFFVAWANLTILTGSYINTDIVDRQQDALNNAVLLKGPEFIIRPIFWYF